MLRFMPQDWEPTDWAEGLAARVAREVIRLRGSRSAQWLSDRTAELGYRISRSVITDLENGRRRYVTVHELVVLAAALSVAPRELLYGDDNGSTVEFLPDEQMQRLPAVQRFSGIDYEILNTYEEKVTYLLEAAKNMKAGVDQVAKVMRSMNLDTEEISDDGG